MDPRKPKQIVTCKVMMSEEAVSYVTNTDLITLVMNFEYSVDNFSEALSHICYANKALTKTICKIALNAITISDLNQISNYLKLVKSQLSLDDLDAKTGESLLTRRLEWIFGFPYMSIGLQEGETQKIGLDSLNHNIKGEVYSYKSMLNYGNA